MAQPEIIKDMFLKVDQSYTDTLNNINLIPGSYALANYTDSSSPLSGIFGTLIQGAGVYKPQIVFGTTASSDVNRIFIRRYKTDSSSYTSWHELITSNNFSSFLDGRYVLKSGDTMTGILTVPYLIVLPEDNQYEGGQIELKSSTSSYSKAVIDLYQNYFRLHDGSTERFRLDMTNGNITFRGLLQNNFKLISAESVTSGTTAGLRNTLLIFGTTYGNDTAYIKTVGKLSLGDPGPQIIFNTENSLTSGQRLALIYTDHDSIGSGNSLSLVSSESNAWFIAPTIKALTKFIGNLEGNATSATQDGNGAVISSTYLPLTGGTMTGTIFHTGESTGRRIITGNLRNAGIKYDYTGRESLIISAGTYANAGISFYTANELNMNDSNGQWNTVSPSVHILKKSLAINYNLTEDPTYNLYVNGTSYFTGPIIATMFKGDTSVAGILPQQSNEINFSSNGSAIWFGYRTPAGSSAVSTYNFGNSSGSATGTIKAGTVYGAVWNDYAEYRSSDPIEPGRVICEMGDGTLKLSTERLQPGANVVSDTFGFAIGETENCKTPIAVSGRALVYTYEDRYSYNAGDPVCAAPGGTVSKMSREEVMMYPDRIVGTVSEIPEYERWGTGDVEVNGRIWIKVK